VSFLVVSFLVVSFLVASVLFVPLYFFGPGSTLGLISASSLNCCRIGILRQGCPSHVGGGNSLILWKTSGDEAVYGNETAFRASGEL
jgi:hypothetical protein